MPQYRADRQTVEDWTDIADSFLLPPIYRSLVTPQLSGAGIFRSP